MFDLIDSCEGNVCQHTKQKRACVRYRGEHIHADILEQIHLAASTSVFVSLLSPLVCPRECELGMKESGVRTARFIIQNQAIMHD